MQRHEEVGVTREIGAHGQLRLAVLDGARIDAFAQAMCQTQHHIFFAGAAGADGAGVFAAMAGVQRKKLIRHDRGVWLPAAPEEAD